MRKVAIVAAAQTGYKEKMAEYEVAELVYVTVKKALEEAHLELKDVDTVVEVGSDYWDGQGCSNISTLAASGAYMKESTKVEADGLFGFLYAYMKVLSGHHETAIVSTYSKSSLGPGLSALTNIILDPFFLRPLGLDYLSHAAIQAGLYKRRWGGDLEEAMTQVAVKNRTNALQNPHAARREPVTADQVTRSQVLAYPLRELHCAGGADGACALILASEERAKKITDNPVWILGVGWAADYYGPGERDALRSVSMLEAAQRAYARAGIEDPRRQVDLFEVYDLTAWHELLMYEVLGLCRRGEGPQLLKEGITARGGPCPVNPSGGLLAANPVLVAGAARVAECFLQLTGRAEGRQVRQPQVAVAHAMEGYYNTIHGVVVLGRG